MPKYHISEDGNPRPCHAEVCPLGSAVSHIESDSMDEVRRFAEAVNAERFETFQSTSREPSFDESFGSDEDRTKKLWPLLSDFSSEIWSHPMAGRGGSSSFDRFYEAHHRDYTEKLANSFDLSPKNVMLSEDRAIIHKDGKFLLIQPIGMYADTDSTTPGMEISAENLRQWVEDEEFEDDPDILDKLNPILQSK